MRMGGSKDLKEIPDLSRATNLEKLFLDGCSSLVELPSSIQHLNKLEWLSMSQCTNLEILPSGINLQTLLALDLSGCSQLKSFPDISRNVNKLYLSHTAIEEIPWWVENFNRLQYLYMDSCNMLKYAFISTPKSLLLVDFSYCGALVGVGWNGYPSGVAMKTDQIDTELPVPEEASSYLHMELLNCFNIDFEALLPQQSVFKQLKLSGEEVPLYFTHRAKGTSSSLTIPLLQSSLPYPFIRLRVCAVIQKSTTDYVFFGDIELNCRFKDRLGNHFDCSAYEERHGPFEEEGGNMFVFDTCFPCHGIAKHNFDQVDIQFHFNSDHPSFELKEWGIRLLEDNSLAENQLGDPNNFPHVYEDNMANGIEHIQELGTLNTVLSLGLSSSSILKAVGDEVNKRNRDSEIEVEHGRTSKQIKKCLELGDAEHLQLMFESSNRSKSNLSIENEEKSCSFIPDLNMTPNEEDAALYGTTVQAKEAETRPDNS